MLIQPWDTARSEDEWHEWLRGRDFGLLAANGVDGGPPMVVPSHFLFDGEREVCLHLARPNPIWAALEADPQVTLTVADDYAYIPSTWRAPVDGVPTSYYAAVQLLCRAEILDEREDKAEILRRQLAHHQPGGGYGTMSATEGPYQKMLSAIRGLRLEVVEVRAKFKYDNQKPVELRERVAGHLAARDQVRDAGARTQILRHLAAGAES
ncbi:FMN-binding negative transcriptional regulator [Nonomuraea endophytica]|uniref:Transcriptional regulator n=1 Tax=Nonomuraea endophytica TaxID=714136 RepID=A0A7W8ENC5_9ACTN|nr:FMN-binding negative transcriptional regulator [Nonomuraea endophytica]MBB5084942.1 transcriptional regulator [Nonomuraea endophytica]